MPRSLFLTLCLFAAVPTLALVGCDSGSEDPMTEDPGGDPGGESGESACTATIGGASFEARTLSARALGSGEFTLAAVLCTGLASDGEGYVIFIEFDEGVFSGLGTYPIGDRVTASLGVVEENGPGGEASAGEVVVTTFTDDRFEGTFEFTVPDFGGQSVSVTGGSFADDL